MLQTLLSRRPTNGIAVNEEHIEVDPVVARQLETNDDFRAFIDRCIAIDHFFLVRKRGASSFVPVTLHDQQGMRSSAEVCAQWYKCCLREYLERRRQFNTRLGSRTRCVARLASYVVLVLCVLVYLWPVWDLVLGVETSYYDTLGIPTSAGASEIRRAYREKVKRWHPDRNPDCGPPCRTQMIKIQNAYDVLLARGDMRFELARQYREQLQALRYLLDFRLASIVSNSLNGMTLVQELLVHRGVLPSAMMNFLPLIRNLGFAFFIAHDIAYISGFSIGMIVNMGFVFFTMQRATFNIVAIQRQSITAYVDAMAEFALAIVPVTVLQAVYLMLTATRDNVVEQVAHSVWGIFFVMAYLNRFTPNIYDNLLLRKFSLPYCYIHTATMTFSWTTFVVTELSFVVDDIMAFTCGVPVLYRLVVYAMHTIQLGQLFLLSWDGPIVLARAPGAAQEGWQDMAVRHGVRSRSSRRPQDELECKVNRIYRDAVGETHGGPESGETAAAAESAAPQAEQTEKLPQSDPASTTRPLTAEEVAWLQQVDREPVMAIDMYRFPHVAHYRRTCQPESCHALMEAGRFGIGYTDNYRDVVLYTSVDETGQSGLAERRGTRSYHTRTTRSRVNVLYSCFDITDAYHVALNSGPEGMVRNQPPKGDLQDLRDSTRLLYESYLGKEVLLTSSQKWRLACYQSMRWPTRADLCNALQNETALLLCSLAGLFFLTLVVLAYAPRSEMVVLSTLGLPGTMRPLMLSRFASVLPSRHPFQHGILGQLSTLRGSVLLLTMDLWDALKHAALGKPAFKFS